jgi:hypothetical protein
MAEMILPKRDRESVSASIEIEDITELMFGTVLEEDPENYKALYEKAQKELEVKEKRIAELEDVIRDYLRDEVRTLDDTESSLKQRRIKAESLLHKLG